MGYTPGLTLFIVPYDWRKPVGVNDAAQRIQKSIDRSWDISGKPAVILAHSYGNKQVHFALRSLLDKTTKVKKWIALAPAFLGAGRTLSYLTEGTPSLYAYGLGLDVQD